MYQKRNGVEREDLLWAKYFNFHPHHLKTGLGYISLWMQRSCSDKCLAFSKSLSSDSICKPNSRKKIKMTITRTIKKIMNKIGLLTVLIAVVGGLFFDWGGAVIGAVVGFFLDDYLRR